MHRPLVGLASAVLALAVVVGFVVLVVRASGPEPAPSPSVSVVDPSRFLLGDYAGAIYRGTGIERHIDAAATVAALNGAHINTYAYLICPVSGGDRSVSKRAWTDLPEFAAAAGASGIAVFVYLCPPTEAPAGGFPPFQWDYRSWAANIARLAVTTPAIAGLMIDDFGGNVRPRPTSLFYFTPTYVHEMMRTARAITPGLRFLPVLYHHDLVGSNEILGEFRTEISGVVFPYAGRFDGQRTSGNTRDATLALAQGYEVSAVLRAYDLPLIFMTYAVPLQHEAGVGATPAYVIAVLEAVDQLHRRHLIDGSLVFRLPLPDQTPAPLTYTIVRDFYAGWG